MKPAGLAEALGLAAAPAFAGMAVLTGVSGDGAAQELCASGPGPTPGGMVTMYLLMSAFHLGPWLRLRGGWTRHRPAS